MLTPHQQHALQIGVDEDAICQAAEKSWQAVLVLEQLLVELGLYSWPKMDLLACGGESRRSHY
jgi:hypothetical protein